MFAPGDAFLLKADLDPDRRKFYFVASDPGQDPDNILLLPVSSWDKDKDQSCVLEVAECGECAFVTHKSYIAYNHAKILSTQHLSKLLKDGEVTRKQNVGPHILAKARQGALASQDIARKHRLLLSKQGLLSAP
jgi:hypothetical protein